MAFADDQLMEVEATRDLTQTIVHVDMDAFVGDISSYGTNLSTQRLRCSATRRSRARRSASAAACSARPRYVPVPALS